MPRKAILGDIPQIRALYARLFEEMAELQPAYWCPAETEERFLAEAIASQTADIFVVCEDGGVVGFVVVRESETLPYPCLVPHRFASLVDMLVHPRYRDRGLGARMIDRVKEWARDRGLDYVELQVLEENSSARDLYERNGFAGKLRTLRVTL